MLYQTVKFVHSASRSDDGDFSAGSESSKVSMKCSVWSDEMCMYTSIIPKKKEEAPRHILCLYVNNLWSMSGKYRNTGEYILEEQMDDGKLGQYSYSFYDRRRGFKMMRYLPNKQHLNTVEKKPALWWKSALAFFCDVM
ncbi:hypothetical protein PsorP6_007398 [Peronosclerospora sorghi]|uniref:Uncharacterized protein n=1 Tax=Peronosclerospora sorghi TaxID=230839 RepID=A0ACC0W964_9STRA|nr:hypothetical protein PsorP6_007398 [Peronosclerospora sorghi]